MQVPKRNDFILKLRRDKIFLLLLLPTILYYVIFKYLPMFGIVISFKQYEIFKGVWASDWVGLKHYITFFQSHNAWKIIRNTFLLGFYSLIFGFPAPILLALMLNELRQRVLKRILQSLSYLPHFISIVVVTSMAAMFLSPTNGIINHIIGFFGVDPIPLLQKASWFRTIYVSTGMWQEVGWGSIIYLAALTTIDPQLYDSAEMDGASRARKIWHITIPGIMPAIVILLILRVGNIIDIGFEKVYLLYNPATYETADILSTYVYRTGLIAGNYSYGAAIDIFSGAIGFVFVVTINYLARKVGEHSLW